jgi:hypothetical protein
VKELKGKFLIAQIYVDDIVFGGMSNKMVQHFVQQMCNNTDFDSRICIEKVHFFKKCGYNIFKKNNTYLKLLNNNSTIRKWFIQITK